MKWDEWRKADGAPPGLEWDTVPDDDLDPGEQLMIDAILADYFRHKNLDSDRVAITGPSALDEPTKDQRNQKSPFTDPRANNPSGLVAEQRAQRRWFQYDASNPRSGRRRTYVSAVGMAAALLVGALLILSPGDRDDVEIATLPDNTTTPSRQPADAAAPESPTATPTTGWSDIASAPAGQTPAVSTLTPTPSPARTVTATNSQGDGPSGTEPSAQPTTLEPTLTPTADPSPTAEPTPTPSPTAPAVLPVPSGLQETNQGVDPSGRPFINLQWSKATEIPIVQVERDGLIVSDDDNLAFYDVPDPAFVAGQVVTYRIRSKSDTQTSQWTDPLNVTVLQHDLLVPTSFREDGQGIDPSGRPFISIAWAKPPGVSSVEIEREGVIIGDDDNLAFYDVPDPALVAGHVVTYRIRSKNGTQTSQWTDPLTITVLEHELPVPTNLREDNQGLAPSGQPFISLAWAKPPGIPIVQIERDGLIITDDDNLAYRDVPEPALVAGQQVTYRIRSKNGTQTSQWTDPLTITVR